MTDLGRLAIDLGLDDVKLLDTPERLFGDWRLGRVVDIEEVAAGMGHAGNLSDRRRLVALGSVQALITGIGVGVQEALVSGEVIARPLTLAIRAIAIECRRRSVPGPWSLVNDVGP